MNRPFDSAKYARLLEGLEATEVILSETLSNPDFRIDAEFYKKLPPTNPSYRYAPIGSILTMAQYGLSITMNEEDGFPIYRMNEISNMLCNEEVNKFAAISAPEAEPFMLRENDVLFNRTNSQVFVGRTGIYKPFDNSQRIFASYLIRFRTDESIVLPEYLTTFLNTRFGEADIKRRARISINQSNVNAEEVKATLIPILSRSFQFKIRESFDIAHASFMESRRIYQEAERLLLTELGLVDWQPPQPQSYERRASTAFAAGRLDAEYFSPRVERLLARLGQDALTVGDVAPPRLDKFIPSDSPDALFDYVEIGDLKRDGTTESQQLLHRDAPSRATWYVQPGDVITSTVRPIRRLSALIREDQAGFVCSSGFLVLNPIHISTERLLVYLRLPLICELMDLHTTASMYPAISPADLLALPFPQIPSEAEQQLIQAIQAAHQTKHDAHALLARATRAVEIAIEESEAAALRFLATA